MFANLHIDKRLTRFYNGHSSRGIAQKRDFTTQSLRSPLGFDIEYVGDIDYVLLFYFNWKGKYSMIKKSIKFTSVNEIKDFVNLTMTQPFDIDLIAGRYVADAKSILSVFGLDLDSEVTLGIHATEEQAAAYLGKIAKYLA